jgi:hypothetical protein
VTPRITARSILLAAVLAAGLVAGSAPAASAKVPRLIFPVVGPSSYVDDFGDPRGSRRHEGNDIMAPKRALAVAAEAGIVKFWTTSRNAGCMLYLYGRSGTTYQYIHLNNDLTAKNDNRGTCVPKVAYAPGLHDGDAVRAGELIGFVGDSGDADGGAAHLHFELHPGGGAAVSPYQWLQRGRKLLYAAPTDAARPLELTLLGAARATAPGDDAEPRLTVAVRQVRLSNGWTMTSDRAIVLRVPPEAVVERTSQTGARPGALEDVKAGEQLSATVEIGEPTLKTQLASPGVLAAASLLLQGK